MKRIINFIIIALFIVATISCGESNSTEPSNIDDIIEPPQTIAEVYFNLVLHGSFSEEQKSAILDSLVNNRERIMNHIQVGEMPRITVAVWSKSNSDAFYATMQDRLGRVFSGATGYTPSPGEMFMLYSSSTPKEVIHEYAHLVSLKKNPTISNNPRWFWEAIAQYESRMFKPLSQWNRFDLVFPGLNALEEYNSSLPYNWGYYISECIIKNFGDEEYVEMIVHNAEVESVLGVSKTEFGIMVENYVNSQL